MALPLVSDHDDGLGDVPGAHDRPLGHHVLVDRRAGRTLDHRELATLAPLRRLVAAQLLPGSCLALEKGILKSSHQE